MGIHTEENKHPLDFNLDSMLDRMKEGMRKIIEDSLNNCAGQYSEDDEQAKRPTEEGCANETAKSEVEKTALCDRLTVTTPTEQADSEKIAPPTCIVTVLPGNTCKIPVYIRGRAADVQATEQLTMPRRDAKNTRGRDDLETHFRKGSTGPGKMIQLMQTMDLGPTASLDDTMTRNTLPPATLTGSVENKNCNQ